MNIGVRGMAACFEEEYLHFEGHFVIQWNVC